MLNKSELNSSPLLVPSIRMNLEAYSYSSKIAISYYVDLNGRRKLNNLNEFFSKITVIEDFDKNSFPYVVLELRIPRNVLLDMQDNFVNLKFLLSIDSVRDSANDGFSYLTNDVFLPIDIENFNLPNEEEFGASVGDVHSIKFNLMLKEHLELKQRIINMTFIDSTMKDVIVSMLNHSFPENSKSTIILKSPENNKVYDNVLLNNSDFFKTLVYLQNAYGLYNTGLRYFYSFKSLFITSLTDTYERKDSPKEAFIEVYDITQGNEVIRTKPVSFSNKSMIFRVANDFVKSKVDPIKNQILHGSQIKFVSGNNEDFEKRFSKEQKIVDLNGLSFERRLEDSYSNEYVANSTVHKLNSEVEKVNLLLSQVPISIFDIDTLFNLKYFTKQSSMQGSYRITRKEVYITRTQGEGNPTTTSVVVKMIRSSK